MFLGFYSGIFSTKHGRLINLPNGFRNFHKALVIHRSQGGSHGKRSEKEFPLARNYKNIRSKLQTGDLAIFGGHYRLSKLIRLRTRFPASHVASIIRKGDRIRYVEASEGDMYPEREGVIVSEFSNSIPFYKGDIWIARLRDDIRKHLDEQKLYDFLMAQVGKEYDYDDMAKAGFDRLDHLLPLTRNREDDSALFYSELVAVAYKHVGILPEQTNFSELTPAEIIKLKIYEPRYYQIKAFNYKAVKLPGFNTVTP